MNVPNTLMKSHERPTSWNIGSFVPIANLVFDPGRVRRAAERQVPDDRGASRRKRGSGRARFPISSAGAGSNTHLDLIAFEDAASVKLLHVPYEGGGQSRTALLGGHVEIVASALGDVQRFIEQGQLKALAIGSKTRFPLAPNIPTFIEQGFKVEGGASRGLIAPKGTPQEYIDALAAATEKALKDPELIKKSNEIALPLDYMSPAAYGAYLRPRTRSSPRRGRRRRGRSKAARRCTGTFVGRASARPPPASSRRAEAALQNRDASASSRRAEARPTKPGCIGVFAAG